METSSSFGRSKIVILTEEDNVPGSKFTNNADEYTVDQLKRWLKCRGLKQSGKRGELLTRVKGCLACSKWLKAKTDKDQLPVNGSLFRGQSVLVPPEKGWRVFPSHDIPNLFNYVRIANKSPRIKGSL